MKDIVLIKKKENEAKEGRKDLFKTPFIDVNVDALP